MLHQITVEMCTGFLLLAGLSVAAKAASDGWTRYLSGRLGRFDRWVRHIASFAEPASLVALLAGVGGAFLSMFTGSNAWSTEDLMASPAVHNKLLLVGLSQSFFLSALVVRLRFRARIWSTPTTGAFYAALVLVGDGLMVLQNSVGAHLAGSGSLLDDLLASVGIDSTSMWALPLWAAIGILIVFPLATLHVGRKLRASVRSSAQASLGRLARDVKDLVAYARKANLMTDQTERRIRKANVQARRKDYRTATRLLARAKADLMAALSFTETPEGDWMYTGPDALGDGELDSPVPTSNPAAGTEPLAIRAGSAPVAPTVSQRLTATGRLSTAVDLAAPTDRRVEDDPVLSVQRELHRARDAIYDLKIEGRDLVAPIEILKAVGEHARREEWDDAFEGLREFRRVIRVG